MLRFPRHHVFLLKVVAVAVVLVAITYYSSAAAVIKLRKEKVRGNAKEEVTPTHVFLIVLDDVGYGDTTCTSTSKAMGYSTPNMESQCKKNGILLSNYYTQPVCSPARSALLTGKYPFFIGFQHKATVLPGSGAHLPLEIPILAEFLKNSLNYETHAIGKWHLGYASVSNTPTRRGFDTFFGYMQGQVDYYNKTVAQSGASGGDFWDCVGVMADYRHCHAVRENVGVYSLDQYMKRFETIIVKYKESHKSLREEYDNSLFVYFAQQSVHIPLQARKEKEDQCGNVKNKVRNLYCRMIMELDQAMGSVENLLRKNNLWDNSLMIVVTDNGGMVAFTAKEFPVSEVPPAVGSVGSNYPLRGSKTTLFEGGVKALAYVTGGKLDLSGENGNDRIYANLVHAVDIPFFILKNVAREEDDNDYGEEELRNAFKLNGFDLNANGKRVRTEVPINVIDKGKAYSAIRFDRYKLIVGGASLGGGSIEGWWPANGVDAPLLPTSYLDDVYLFDLVKDPSERFNLYPNRSDLVREGLKLLQAYVKQDEYQEPVQNKPHWKALPVFHRGMWAPFMRGDEEESDVLIKVK